MIKISQKTVFDEYVSSPMESYYTGERQKKLPGFYESTTQEKPRSPIEITTPALEKEHLKITPLTEKEREKVIREIDDPWKYEKNKYLSIYELDKALRSQDNQVREQAQEELKTKILEKYNEFKKVFDNFMDKYKEANKMAETENPLNIKNISYSELMRNISKFLQIEIYSHIGHLFGHNIKEYKLMDLINKKHEGLKLFNITPINFQENLNKIDSYISSMNIIIKDYEKRKKLLNNLEKNLHKNLEQFLSDQENIKFLKWLDENLADEKQEFANDLIEQIKSGYSSHGFDLKNLEKIKTYKSIYEKAKDFITKSVPKKIMVKTEEKIHELMIELFIENINKKIDFINMLLKNIDENNSSKIFENFLDFSREMKKLTNIDLMSLFNFAKNRTVKRHEKYKSDQGILGRKYKSQFGDLDINDLMKSYLLDFFTQLKKYMYVKYNDDKFIRNKVEDIVNRIYITKNDLEKINSIGSNYFDKQVNEFINENIIDSLPNFSSKYNVEHIEKYDKMADIADLAKQSGKISIESFTNYISSKVPQIPKNFVLQLVKEYFKTIDEVNFRSLEDLTHQVDNLKNSITILLEIMKKDGKYDPNNFVKYVFKPKKSENNTILEIIEDYYRDIRRDLNKFSDEDIVKIIINSIRGIGTLDQDLKTIRDFAIFIHNDASEITNEAMFKILQNTNYRNFSKIGIVKKLINSYAVIKSKGGLKNIIKLYGPVLTELKRKNFIDKNFNENVKFVESFFESNKEVHPKSEIFSELFEKTSKLETDISTLEIADSLKEFLKDYKPKNKNLFKLDMNINDNLRFRVLKDKDPRTLRIGIETNCCQRIGGAGEISARDSFINPLAGVLILEYKNDQGSWNLLSQSYFHYVPEDNGYILDNVEYNYKNIEDSKADLDDIYAYYAEQIKNKLNVKYFLSGKGYSKIESKKFKSNSMKKDPRYFDQRSLTKDNKKFYTDFDEKSSIDLLQPKFKTDKLKENIDKKFSPKQEEAKTAWMKELRMVVLSSIKNIGLITNN